MILKYLQPSQYESWLRKADDPDWTEHRYRDSKDRALVSFARELRDCLATLDKAQEDVKSFRAKHGLPFDLAAELLENIRKPNNG